jgi:hypothetical protein
MKGEIDTSFETLQRDLFASGTAARIGMNAFGVWIAKLTGLSLGAVSNSVEKLLEAKLLRIIESAEGRKSNRYVARERLDVKLGERVLCTIVLDYVPARLRKQLDHIEESLRAGCSDATAFADCEILPGPGFVWDAASGSLQAAIPYDDFPDPETDRVTEPFKSSLEQKVLALQKSAKHRRKTVEN